MGKRGQRPRIVGAEKSQGPTWVRLSMRVSAACARRLELHCTVEKESRGDVIERLILQHIPKWMVQDRTARDVPEEPAA